MHHHGLLGDHRAKRRIQPGGFSLGQEVQGIGQQGPPLTPWSEKADVIQRDPAALACRYRFPANQPCWAEPPLHTDNLDVFTAAPFHVLADFSPEPGRPARWATCYIDGYRRSH